ncbi:MAG: hypothetical protein KJS98_01375 [Nitrospirae bacterium]|nr:hypothetical protein [Nitrospirota bacterium]MDE3042424.1 hypothetical protein [Nitrospirota bacterium]MDE3049211.1 hypothetical protein [Nitrospirota bacterium]
MPGHCHYIFQGSRRTPALGRTAGSTPLIAEDSLTKAIAQKLNLSIKTVETHRRERMRRLDIHVVAGLVRCAIRTGLVTLGTEPDRPPFMLPPSHALSLTGSQMAILFS